MAQPHSTFHDTLDRLQQLGLDPPTDEYGIIAVGGEDFPRLPQSFLNDALMEVSTVLAGSTAESSDQQRGSNGSQGGSSTVPRSGAGPTQRAKRTHRKTKKINEYFEPITSMDNSYGRTFYRCRHCVFEVTQQKQREKVFHLILCSHIQLLTRTGLYMTCNDKERPPLLRHPLHHMTASAARRLIRVQHELMKGRLDGLKLVYDPSGEPRLTRYLLDVDRVKKSTTIGKCSEEEFTVANDLLLDFIIDENMPYAICDNKYDMPRPFKRFVSYLRPGYKLPSGYLIRTKLLNQYYKDLKHDVQSKLRTLLKECHGTVMFDGSENVNGAPMVNILLRVMGSARISTSTYFLTTVYTGYDTVDANYYVKMTEKALEEFGGFENIAGIVTDNTGSVKNAREMLERKYPRLVASQDQAHVADRLLGDFGEIPWIREVRDKLSAISSILKRFRKLRARMMEIIQDHNKAVRISETPENMLADDGATTNDGAEVEGELDSEEETDDDEPEHIEFLAGASVSEVNEWDACSDMTTAPDEGCTSTETEVAPVTSVGPSNHHWRDISSVSRTAVTMKKPSSVRFASTEKLLEEYVRLRPVLLKLIEDPHFDSIYGVRTEAEIRKREDSFISVVRDQSFLLRVKQAHGIFRACRTYLRVFDSETSIASEVYEATRILKQILEALPLESFPEPCVERRRELLDIFENRRIGPLPGRKRIKINLISDFHVAAALLDPFRSPPNTRPNIEALIRHIRRYFSGVEMSSLSLDHYEKNAFVTEVLNQYLLVRARWIENGWLRERSDTTSSSADANHSNQYNSSHSPIVWWSTGLVFKPSHPLSRKAAEELVEFAIRTLSVSPTATATERTFSLENRMHTNQRASLSKARVQKMLFCQWNSRVMRRSVQRDAIDIKWELERQGDGMRKLRALRSTIVLAPTQERRGTAMEATATDGNRSLLATEGGHHLGTSGSDVAAPVREDGVIFNSVNNETVQTQLVTRQDTENTTRNASSAARTHSRNESAERAAGRDVAEQVAGRDVAEQVAGRDAEDRNASPIAEIENAMSEAGNQANKSSALLCSLRGVIQATLMEYGIKPGSLSSQGIDEIMTGGAEAVLPLLANNSAEDDMVGRKRRRRSPGDSQGSRVIL